MGTSTPLPAERFSAPAKSGSNQTFVQFGSGRLHASLGCRCVAPAADEHGDHRRTEASAARSRRPVRTPSRVPMHRFQGGATEDVVLGNLGGIEVEGPKRLHQV